MVGAIVSFYIQGRYFYLSEQHGFWIDSILTEKLTMRKMIPTDFVLTLPNILGCRCTCIKSHDQSRLIPPCVRREFLISVKMAENLVGYARKYLLVPWDPSAHSGLFRVYSVAYESARYCIYNYCSWTSSLKPSLMSSYLVWLPCFQLILFSDFVHLHSTWC